MNTSPARAPGAIPGRGASLNPPNRFERLHLEPDPDETAGSEPPARRPRTEFFHDTTTSLLTRNDSPDLRYEYGLNAYRGCEHGCAYCYARQYHEYLGWSSGLDFETKVMVKLQAPAILRRELTAPRWRPQPIAMSGATDCYQPAERQFKLTRACLEVCAELRHPIFIITKNALVTRDLDVLTRLAARDCVAVHISITTLDADLGGKLEPRASRPEARLRAIRELSAAGIPVGVLAAPMIPGLTDHELPAILEAAGAAGARVASYTSLRLPFAVKDIFLRWLDDHEPAKKARVLDRLREMGGGRLYATDWGSRLTGRGIFAEQLRTLFDVTARRAGLNRVCFRLATAHFRRPGEQLTFL
jgi:DNA repair photolyase